MPPTQKMENLLWKQGFKLIAGVDEVGVGPLAGPVLAAAVILPAQTRIKGLDDSKMLSSKKREELYSHIIKKALGIGIGIVDRETIDKINILKASHLAMQLALEALSVKPDFVLVDGKYPVKYPIPQISLIGGDKKCAIISAASIVAKVARDKIMESFDAVFPQFGFRSHKGYGTKLHMKNIIKYGPSPIHRRSFFPVKGAVNS